MSINFKGINNPQVFIKKSEMSPEKAHAIILSCNLTNDGEGKDLFELKEKASRIPEVSKFYSSFTENDKFTVKIIAKDCGADKKWFDLLLNDIPINLDEYSVFSACTLVCAFTQKFLRKVGENTNMAKFVVATNKVVNQIGKKALKKVF